MRTLILIVYCLCFKTTLAFVRCDNVNCTFRYLGYDGVTNILGRAAVERDFLGATASSEALDNVSSNAWKRLRELNYLLYNLEQSFYERDTERFASHLNAVAKLRDEMKQLHIGSRSSAEEMQEGDLNAIRARLSASVAEEIGYSFIRMGLSSLGGLSIQSLSDALPDDMFINGTRSTKRLQDAMTFRNMIAIAIALENCKRGRITYPDDLDSIGIDQRFLENAKGRRLKYYRMNDGWRIVDSEESTLRTTHYKPSLSREWKGMDICLGSDYNLLRKKLYNGGVIECGYGSSMQHPQNFHYEINHKQAYGTNAVHSIVIAEWFDKQGQNGLPEKSCIEKE